MNSRLLSRRALLTSLVGAGSVAAAAQTAKPVRPDGQGLAGEPPVLSGSDWVFESGALNATVAEPARWSSALTGGGSRPGSTWGSGR